MKGGAFGGSALSLVCAFELAREFLSDEQLSRVSDGQGFERHYGRAASAVLGARGSTK